MSEFIYECDDAFDLTFCKDVINRFEKDDRKEAGKTEGGVNVNVKKSTDLSISENDYFMRDWSDVIDKVLDIVKVHLIKYKQYLTENNIDKNAILDRFLNSSCIGFPHIQKTEPGGFYRWHIDSYINRTYTYILYLNDVEEGCGGTTEFACGRIIQPKAGKIVFFPSTHTYIHRNKKLERGEKYIIINFIYNNKPIFVHPNPT